MKKTYIIFLLLVVALAVFLFSLGFFVRKQDVQNKTPQQTTTPTTTATLTPNVKPITVSPANDSTKKYLPIQQIAITYSGPVVPGSVFVSSSPPASISARQGDNPSTIIISSNPAWTEGVTKISVYNSGNTEPFIYNLNTGYPPLPNPDSDY